MEVDLLEELIEKGKTSGDATKEAAATALQAKLDEVMASNNHRWFNGDLDPADKAERQKRMEEFKDRYK